MTHWVTFIRVELLISIMTFILTRNLNLVTKLVHTTAFSTKPPSKFFNQKVKKGLTLAALLAFVGGIYLTAVTKMKQSDDLASLVERETMTTEKPK